MQTLTFPITKTVLQGRVCEGDKWVQIAITLQECWRLEDYSLTQTAISIALNPISLIYSAIMGPPPPLPRAAVAHFVQTLQGSL